MIFLGKVKTPAWAVLLLLSVVFASCEEELTTIGEGVIGSDPFTTDKISYPVFAFNKKVEAVQTNRLPLYQLGVYDDPLYGRTEAQITSQLRLSTINPTFGSFRPEDEVADPDNPTQIAENETVKEVFLYIPYLSRAANQRDSDSDGVDDIFDAEPNDPSNDTDGDGLTNAEERSAGTDPQNDDTDGDGILDGEDDDTIPNVFANTVDLDSIFGRRDQTFNIKVQRSTFFLRNQDPNTNFEEQQEYFSTQQFNPAFVSDVLFDGDVTIDDKEIVTLQEDDPDTEVDESEELASRLAPGIRIPLNPTFFQENILDKEGSSELQSQTNFSNFLRGVNITLTPENGEELLLLFDIAQANITITYTFQSIDNNNTPTDTSDDEQQVSERDYVLNLLQILGQSVNGNAVNTFINEAYPPEITDQFGDDLNASRIYLKGGAGSYAEIKLFDEDTGEASEIIEEIRSQNWIINEANLVFYIDREALDAMGGNPTGDDEPLREPFRLYLYNMETGAPLINFVTENSVTQDLFGSFLNYDGFLEEEDGKGVKYTVRITDHINNLVVRDEENATLGLTFTPNISQLAVLDAMVNGDDGVEEVSIPIASTLSPAGTVLYGSDSSVPENLRLKLELFYTEAN